MSSSAWYPSGRALAVVYAATWFAGTWIFTLVSFAIISPPPPEPADRVAHYAYKRAVYPRLYLAVICFGLGFHRLVRRRMCAEKPRSARRYAGDVVELRPVIRRKARNGSTAWP